MTNLKWLASFVLAVNMVPALLAETHCPGNVESVPFRLVNRYQMVVPVFVNRSGPYNFLLDTGTQITMLDPSLVAKLHLTTQGAAVVASVGSHASASYAQLDVIAVGSHSWVNHMVLAYDLKNLQATSLDVDGVEQARACPARPQSIEFVLQIRLCALHAAFEFGKIESRQLRHDFPICGPAVRPRSDGVSDSVPFSRFIALNSTALGE